MTSQTRISRLRLQAHAPRACLLLLPLLVSAGCSDSSRGADKPSLFGGSQGPQERWTIRCARFTAGERSDFALRAQQLAEMLRQVRGLQPRAVRVAPDANGSTIYYGEYVKVASSSGSLVFPPEFQKDIELIRSLAANRETPFFYARPEQISAGSDGSSGEYDISRAKGPYSLQIAVFHDTPTFNQRKQAAEQYVGILRGQGFPAYYYHEAARSFVFIGDFDESDVVITPQGPRCGPRVEQLITRNEAEFRYISENGHLRKEVGPDGKLIAPQSMLIRLPQAGGILTPR